MRAKALVLGALPTPFEGAWVSIGEAESWRCQVELSPSTASLNAGVRLDIELSNGSIVPCTLDQVFSGRRARFVLEEQQEGIVSLCVFIKELENESLRGSHDLLAPQGVGGT